MRGFVCAALCLGSLSLQALEYEPQLENDQIRVAKVKILPHEEIGAHRDEYAQVVIALKGGVITRLEADGRTTDVQFPTGLPVFREPDPVDELHRSVNASDEPIELLIVQLKDKAPFLKKEEEDAYSIALDVQVNCPDSEEFQVFIKSIPPNKYHSVNYEDWKKTFMNSMAHLMQLVETDKVFSSTWRVRTDFPRQQTD
jgi:hypothetical protein